jgi:hypothetical protein
MIDNTFKPKRQCSKKGIFNEVDARGWKKLRDERWAWSRSHTRREWIMLNRVLQNHWCRFLAGNLSVGLLVVGIPVAILLALTNTVATSWAVLGILAIVHLSLVGLQISRQGTWIPEKWLAAAFALLPLFDAWQTVEIILKGLVLEGLLASLLALGASALTAAIVKNQWNKWRAPKPVVIFNPTSGEGHQAHQHHADDPISMVY